MKLLILTLLTLSFFTQCNLTNVNSNFEENYKKAVEDNYNAVSNSIYYDKAISSCKDITKYPELLMFKGSDILFKDPVTAAKYLKLAKLYCKDNKDLLIINTNLGLSYLDFEKFKKAKIYFLSALENAKKINDAFEINECSFNLFLCDYEILREKQSIDKFWFFYKNLSNTNEALQLQYLNIFFELNNEKKQFKESLKSRDYILTNFNIKSHSKAEIVHFYLNNSRLELNLKNYEKALKYCDSSCVITKELNDLDDREFLLEELHLFKDIYQQQGKLEIALQYTDSISEAESKIKKININSNIEILDENILFKKMMQKTKEKTNHLKIGLVTIVLIAMFLVLFFLIKNKKEKEKLQKLKSEIIVSKGKYNELLKNNNHFKKEVNTLLKEKDFEGLVKAQKKISIDDFNNQQYIKYLASKIDNTFIEKLNHQNISFSEIEKLVLFYRKNNHTHKEISMISNKTIRSIENLSYRLNKKILKETGLDLLDFIRDL